MSIILYYGALDISDEINYKIDLNGFKAPEPTVKQQYADSALRHGQLPTEAWKYNNRILDFSIQVFGSTPAELDANIKILEYTVCVAGAVVTYCPNGRTTNIYFDAYRPEEVDPSTYFERTYQQANMAIIRWSVQAYPFGHTDRRFLYPCRNLALNDSFETRAGDDFENWIETVSGGTITANTSQYLKGGVSCKMTTTGTSDTCALTDEGFLIVNPLHVYNAKLFAYKNSGTLTLDHDLLCHDIDSNLLNSNLLSNENASFEGNTVGGWTAGAWTLTASVADAWHGTHSLKGVSTGIATGNWVLSVTAITTAGTQVTCSLKFKGVAGKSYRVSLYDNVATWQNGTAVVTDGTWQTVIVTGTWGAGSTARSLYFYTSSPAVNDVVYIDAVQLEAGAIATDFNLGPINLLTAYNPAATTWMDVLKIAGSPVVYPWNSGLSPCFPEGTALVKREVRHDTTVGVVSLDSLLFEDADMIQGNELEGAFVINIPADISSGDVPADARIKVGSAYCSSPWSPQASGSGSWFEGVEAVDASHVWAVGNLGKILFYNGLTWASQASGTPYGLKAVSAYNSTHVWAVGLYDEHVYWDGSAWAHQADPISPVEFPPNLYGICAIATNNVIAVGIDGRIEKYVSFWTVVTSGTTYDLHDVDAVDATHIFAVGDHGTIRFSSNGTTWTAQTSGTTVNLRAVYALDSTHVWAVGSSGLILFYNGTHWTRQTSGTTQSLYGVYAYDATNVWAVGSNGTILFFNGTVWTAQGSGTSNTLTSASGVSATSVWAAGQLGTIIHGLSTVGAMPMTNFDMGERGIQYAENFAAVQDAAGTTQVLNVYRHGQYYRSLAAGGTHKFRYPVGSHRGRYILSVGTSWASTSTYDQLSIKLYLETADGVKISPTDISLTPLDLGNPTGLFKETAFATAGTRLIDIDIPSHYVSPKANEDSIYQVIEVTNNAASAEWLDCCTLLPAELCVELSSMAANFLIFDSESGEVLVSQDGSFDTASVYDPTKTVDSPRFVIDPRGSSFVVLAGNIVSGNEHLDSLLDIEISWEPQWLMIPETPEIPPPIPPPPPGLIGLYMDGTTYVKDAIHNLPATIAGTPTFATLMGAQAPVITPGTTNKLSAENSSFETGVGDWVGAYAVSSLSSSTDWADAGTHSLKIVSSGGDVVVALDITSVTTANATNVFSLKFKGVAGGIYWLWCWDDVGGHQSQLMPIVGTGASQTLTFTCVFDAGIYRQISFRANAANAGDVAYIDSVTVVNGPPRIGFGTASLGITPGMPISIVCVVKHTNAWNDGQPHLMFFTNNLYPNGPPWEGFEINATIFGTLTLGVWHGMDIQTTGIALDSTNWAPNVTHVVIATIDAANNQRFFVDGVEGFVKYGGCARETAVGANSYIGLHPDYLFPLNGPELCAIYGDIILTDNEIQAISSYTDWADVPITYH